MSTVAVERAFDDLQSFAEAAKEIDRWKLLEGVHWNRELSALTEAAAELIPEPPMLIFDRIPDYPPGYRVVSLPLASYKRAALALGLPVDRPRLELVRLASERLRSVRPVPPVEVPSGPVMENVQRDEAVDVLRFPAPLFHTQDGGRYIGTGDSLINRDPDSGYINVGTYRMQVHGPDLLGLWMSPGQQGRQICQSYWDRGESCPVVATFGEDPLLFTVSHSKFAWGISELELAGGLRGRPVEVVRGPLTGLPIPAHAEIAIEGEVPSPEVQSLPEGPFGEWPGYYSGGTIGTGRPQPVMRVKAVYHRDSPLLHNQAPLWPGAPLLGLPLPAGLLWDQLERAGIPDVVGVYTHSWYMVVVAIRQRYAGHARQVGHAVLGCSANARNGRYVVIVDEDIDPTDMKEVLWAMETRVDPAGGDIELVDGCWSTPLDPRMPPDRRASGDHTNSRAIFYAVRPYPWRERFPRVSRTERDLRQRILETYRDQLPFPPV
jgi:UbiD family decarboxylase